MSKCRMVMVERPLYGHYRSPCEAGVAVPRCETHQMDLDASSTGDMCALGRIEAATDEALAKIAAARS